MYKLHYDNFFLINEHDDDDVRLSHLFDVITLSFDR